MRFGLAILPEQSWAVTEPMWREADTMGFDHLWTFDHVTWAGLPESPWFAAMPTLAAAALVTSNSRLGTFVSSPNNHHPVQFMREILALHDISGGRFILGVGAGGDVDSQIMGDDISRGDRSARFHEFVPLLERLLSEPQVTAQGRFYGARDVLTRPGPVRAPNSPGDLEANAVPLVIAANGPRAIRLAAERGDGWMTHGGWVDTDAEWWQSLAQLSQTLDQALDTHGRERHTISRYLNIDSAPTFTLSSVGAFEDAVGRADELGFTDVITHWPRPTAPFEGVRATLDTVVADVMPRWR
jgi:alkanesulfonate monooxygenase SsuD/methylene tetrahydromethanopterin reductase-like flavin-dependent oxidoreductase (luciferase family)